MGEPTPDREEPVSSREGWAESPRHPGDLSGTGCLGRHRDTAMGSLRLPGCAGAVAVATVLTAWSHPGRISQRSCVRLPGRGGSLTGLKR